MPGIHFATVRARIPLADVLKLIGFVPCETSRDQVRGPCPVHHSTASTSRSFSANLKRHIYKCFTCGSKGNPLDLYASVTGLSLFEAAIALCKQLDREIPWMQEGNAEPGARRPEGPVKSRRGPAESCTRIPSRNHPGGSILAAIMAQFLTAINRSRHTMR